MKIRILGAGWYGCSLAVALLERGYDVEVWEKENEVFAGASGKIPARLHLGAPHYPRSKATRDACIRHNLDFMDRYGFLTRAVPINLYAVARDHSLMDFGTYLQIVKSEIECITVHDPLEFGLHNVEGAILTGERHIIADDARDYFASRLSGHVKLGVDTSRPDLYAGMTIDCTFCANSDVGVDRYEPCLVLLLEGPVERAVTIMDGPFPSLYPWNPERGLCSLSSAKWTPFSKDVRSYAEAKSIIDSVGAAEVETRAEAMIESMRHFYPAIEEFKIVGHMLSIRAMPLSGADTRLVDVHREDRLIRVRAGKIDAVLDAERAVMGVLS